MRVKNDERPLDLFDRYLNYRTPVYNTLIKSYIRLYGKESTYYTNPNKEGSENNDSISSNDRSENIKENADNYSLAYGKNNVGFNYSTMDKSSAYILADYSDYYKHDIGADEEVQYYLQVEGTEVSRGDIISYYIQNKQVFYRIINIVTSYMDIVYRIDCRLIQVKQLDRYTKLPEIKLPENGVIL